VEKIRIEQHSFGGLLWFAGWLFTIGFLKLTFFWKGATGILLWPVYLGSALSPLLDAIAKRGSP
jgi:hypothetical protein